MTKVALFSSVYAGYLIVDGSKMIAANRSDKIFIKKLESVNNELRGKNFDFNIDINKLKLDYIGITRLQEWASYRGLLN
jgi:hypothetical protein